MYWYKITKLSDYILGPQKMCPALSRPFFYANRIKKISMKKLS